MGGDAKLTPRIRMTFATAKYGGPSLIWKRLFNRSIQIERDHYWISYGLENLNT